MFSVAACVARGSSVWRPLQHATSAAVCTARGLASSSDPAAADSAQDLVRLSAVVCVYVSNSRLECTTSVAHSQQARDCMVVAM